MIHVLLRIAVWVIVIGVGYLVFGPQLFDSSRNASPFQSDAKIFLPPARSERQRELETMLDENGLGPEESAEYQSIVRERQAGFWQQEGTAVEEALSGVKTHRREHLIALLQERGLSQEELFVFLAVVERDHPTLLADRE